MAIGSLRAHLHDEASQTADLIGPERELGRWVRTDHAVGVEPDVVNAHVDQAAQPGLAHQVVDVGLAHARGHADDQPCVRRQLPRPASVLLSTLAGPGAHR